MIILDDTSTTLEIVLGEAISSSQVQVSANWVDSTATPPSTPGSSEGNSNGTTPETIVDHPAASTRRQINPRTSTLFNADGISHVVTLRKNVGGTTKTIGKGVLAAGTGCTFQNLMESSVEGYATPKLDDCAAPDDNTDLDAGISAHGLLMKAIAPAADTLNVVGIGNGETAFTNKTLFDDTDPAALGAAAPGTAVVAAHRDHVHTLPKLDDLNAPDDTTDLDVSTDKHGLVPKLDGSTANYLRGDGTWATPAGGSTPKLDDCGAPDDNTDLNATISAHGLAPKAVAPASGLLSVLGIANGETIRSEKVLGQAARVYHNAAQAASSGIPLVMAFNSERLDTDGIHDTVTNNSRLTCKTAGIYVIGANIEFAAASAVVHFLKILLNGATYLADQSARCPAGSGIITLNVSCIYALAVNDYVEAVALQTTGGNLNVNSSGNYSPEFWMHRIG